MHEIFTTANILHSVKLNRTHFFRRCNADFLGKKDLMFSFCFLCASFLAGYLKNNPRFQWNVKFGKKLRSYVAQSSTVPPYIQPYRATSMAADFTLFKWFSYIVSCRALLNFFTQCLMKFYRSLKMYPNIFWWWSRHALVFINFEDVRLWQRYATLCSL